jgi:glycosyltransferase involved in cell wall biosynthesis
MALVYRAADVLLFTSLDDNLPNVILEAMACGLPSVAHQVGGVRDLLGGGEPTGLLFSPQHAEEGASRILRIFEEPGLEKELAGRSLERARNQFSLPRQASDMVSLYESLPAPVRAHQGEGEEGAQILADTPGWRFMWETWKSRLGIP